VIDKYKFLNYGYSKVKKSEKLSWAKRQEKPKLLVKMAYRRILAVK